MNVTGDWMDRIVPRLAAAIAAAIAITLLAACSANSSVGMAAAPADRAAVAATATVTKPPNAAAATKTAPPPASPQALPVDPGAGSRPQTQKFPSTHSVAFYNAMTDVWLAVTTGNPRFGRPAFFPEAAYAQVKAIADPESDWTGRLWLDFELDVGAAHRVVGSHARLLRVDMAPNWEAAWVPPGYCYNSVGYWHINGARMVYDEDGQERSIGIASLISWRGVWYVVHFGAVIRPAIGIVDDPEDGSGVTGPAGGC